MDDASPDVGEVTRLLRAAQEGEAAALDRLVPLLYEDLRRLARRQLAREYAGRSLNPTALVHESYLKLGGGSLVARDRAHFMALAARAMRQVLVDHARERKAVKRGAGVWERTTLTDGVWVKELDDEGMRPSPGCSPENARWWSAAFSVGWKIRRSRWRWGSPTGPWSATG